MSNLDWKEYGNGDLNQDDTEWEVNQHVWWEWDGAWIIEYGDQEENEWWEDSQTIEVAMIPVHPSLAADNLILLNFLRSLTEIIPNIGEMIVQSGNTPIKASSDAKVLPGFSVTHADKMATVIIKSRADSRM